MYTRCSLPVLVLVSALACSAQQEQEQAKSTGDQSKNQCRLEGRVTNAITGAPVRKARLTLGSQRRENQPADTETDAEGRFVFETVEAGTYTLTARKAGFLDQVYGARAGSYSGMTLTLSHGGQMKDVEVKLTPYSVITGKVLDDEGEPVQHVWVTAMRRKGGGPPDFSAGESSNDLGEFRISNLAPGRYILLANGMMFDDRPATSAGKKGPQEALVPTFHPGVTEAASAVPIEVRAGQEVTGADITLRKARVYRIEGGIAGLTPAQSAGMLSVMAVSREPSALMVGVGGGGGQVKPDGTFEVASVRPGSYELIAVQRGDGRPQPVARAPVEVTDGNVKGVVLQALEPLQVSGVLRVEGQDKPGVGALRVGLMPLADERIPYGTRPAMVAPDGTFKLDGIMPAKYLISLMGVPQTMYIKSISLKKENVLDSGLDLSQAQGAVNVEILLVTKPGTVEGSVQQDDKPAPGGTVFLVPEPMRAARRYSVRMASADQNGRFSIKGVAPGEYRVYAWREDPETSIFRDPDAYKPYEGKSVKITVSEGATASAQLTAIATSDAP